MEEKERYSYDYFIDGAVFIDTENDRDMDMDTVCSLLNKQDKRIKELEETNKILSNELSKNSILKQDHIETCCGIPIFEIPKMKEENQQLKQQLAEKEKELEEVNREFVQSTHDWKEIVDEKIKAKTEFAIQQLQKVKEELNNSAREYIVRLTDGIPVYSSYVTLTQLNETIEETINELKEMK